MNDECLIDFEIFPKGASEFIRAELEDIYDTFEGAYDRRIVMAMRTRVLTAQEEEYALRRGDSLIYGGGFYRPEEVTAYLRQLNDLWFQQRRLQMLARGVNIQ